MSWQAVESVKKFSKSVGTARLVLICIASEIPLDAVSWFIPHPTLCEAANVKERNLRYILRELEESGELKIERATGRGHSNIYQLNLPLKGAEDCRLNVEKEQHTAALDEPERGQSSVKRGQDLVERGQSDAERGQHIAAHPEEPVKPEEPERINAGAGSGGLRVQETTQNFAVEDQTRMMEVMVKREGAVLDAENQLAAIRRLLANAVDLRGSPVLFIECFNELCTADWCEGRVSWVMVEKLFANWLIRHGELRKGNGNGTRRDYGGKYQPFDRSTENVKRGEQIRALGKLSDADIQREIDRLDADSASAARPVGADIRHGVRRLDAPEADAARGDHIDVSVRRGVR